MELEKLFPGQHDTPAGHVVESIGKVLAASYYGLEFFLAKNVPFGLAV